MDVHAIHMLFGQRDRARVVELQREITALLGDNDTATNEEYAARRKRVTECERELVEVLARLEPEAQP